MAVKFLDYTGLGYFWSKIKAWCNATFAAITHNQASSTINAMTGYSKPSSGSAIATSDSLNSAIGKLEYKVDSYDDSNYVHKTGNETITGKKTFTVNTNNDYGQLILKNTHYSTILRNDDNAFYILTTAQNDPDGGWTSAKPFSFNNESGIGAVNSYVPVRSGYAGNLHIFISKTGNDSNNGLTKETAVLTIDKALYLAQGYGISGELYLRFGPGNWGTIDISSNRFLARRIIISNMEYSQPHTVSAFTALTGVYEPPVFDVIALRNGHFHVTSITAIRIDMFNSYVIFAAVNKFANIRAFLSVLEIQGPYIIYSPTGYDSDYIFFLSNSSYKHIVQNTNVSDNKSKFATATTRNNFLLCEGNNYVKIWTDNTWEGSFSGNKFYTNSLLHIASDSIAIDNIPGTNFVGMYTYGNVSAIKYYGTPNIALINRASVKGTAPSSTNYWTIHFSGDPNGTAVNGSLVNNIGYIQCVQTTTSHGVYLYAMKPEANNSADNAVLGLIYDTSGKKYAYTSTPADNSNTTHIATTAWVRRYCETTKGFLTSHQSLSNYVTLNGNQTITGTKTFNSSIYFPNSGGNIIQSASTNYMHIGTHANHSYGAHLFLYGNTVSSDSNLDGSFRIRAAKNNSYKDLVGYENGYLRWTGREIATNVDNQYLRLDGSSIFENGASILATGKSFSGYLGKFVLRASNGTTAKGLDGRPDGTLTWNGNNISVSSDERLKTTISDIPEQILEAWESVNWIQYKYKEDVNIKGEENCRFHAGLVAQRVDKNCTNAGIDILKYGLLCHDTSKDGSDPGNPEEPNIDLWTIRYDEAFAMEAAYQRRKNKILENRISELERQVSDMLQILQSLKGAN